MWTLLGFILAVLTSPRSQIEAENAALQHQLIRLRRMRPDGSGSRMATAFSLSSCIDGFPRSSKSSRSWVRRPWSGGTGQAFVSTGAGSHAYVQDGRRLIASCGRWSGGSAWRTLFGEPRASLVNRSSWAAGLWGRAVERRQVHGQAAGPAQSGMADLPA